MMTEPNAMNSLLGTRVFLGPPSPSTIGPNFGVLFVRLEFVY